MSCRGSEVKLATAIQIFNDRSNTIEFLTQHNAVLNSITCSNCSEECILNENTLLWRCQRRISKTINKKVIVSRCNFKLSLQTDTWFANVRLTSEKCCSFITQYLLLNPPHQQYLINELDISSATFCNWSGFIREVLEYWVYENTSTKIGGRNKMVEIDEAKFGKRKYNRGRVIEGQWIFGGIERETKSFFKIPVLDRKQETLLKIIKEKIRPGTTIISDCWKAYNCLESEGFKHLTVNHSLNFVDPETLAHTQNVERNWRTARQWMPKFSRREEYMSSYIAEFIFRSRFPNHCQRLHVFFSNLQKFYDQLIKG